MPPTRIDRPAQATGQGHQPPGQSPGTSPTGQSPGTPPPLAAGPPAPPTAKPARRRGWGRKNRIEQTPANRLPIQPREATAPAPKALPPSAPRALPSAARPPTPPPPWTPPQKPPAAPGRKHPAAPGRQPWTAPGQKGAPVQNPGRPKQIGPPPAKPRRKRRWGRRLFLFSLFSLVCCCGVPAYFLWPTAQQYPVSAVLPQTVADLDRREDGASKRAVDRLTEQVQGTNLISGDVFAGVYADGNGKRVTLFGTTGLRLTPEQDVEAELAHLSDEYKIKDIQAYDLGESGVHARCGVGRQSGNAVVICGWADHGSLATVLMTRRSVSESAELMGVLRGAVLTRG